MEGNSCLPLPHQALLGGTKGGSSSCCSHWLSQKLPHVPTQCCGGVPACSHVGQQGLCRSPATAMWSVCEHSLG